MNQHDQEMVAVLDDLINNQRAFKEARTKFEQYLSDTSKEDERSAHLYFRGALIESLLGGSPYGYMALARESEGYSETMEGDFRRDVALGLIRKGDFNSGEVERLLYEAKLLHEGDPDRQAVDTMAEGRMYFANHDYARAVELHLEAESIWKHLMEDGKWAEVTEQFRLNNTFHGYCAYVAFRAKYETHPVRRASFGLTEEGHIECDLFYYHFMANEPKSSPRRKAMTLIRRLGYPGLVIVLMREKLRTH